MLPIFTQPNVETIVQTIAERGYIVCDSYFSASSIGQLRNDLNELKLAGCMRKAVTGKLGQPSLVNSEIRGDSIFWLSASQASPVQRAYLEAMQDIQTALNQALYLGLFEYECHFAAYPAGSRYHKHLDQFKGEQTRQVSSVLYLNEDWREEDGGCLRLYVEDAANPHHEGYVDILPLAGRLVLFLSANFLHEVLPSTRERMSITGWFRTRSDTPL